MNNNTIDMHNVDFQDFLKVVDSCKGDVFLETQEGDCLNLKSKLCQFIGLRNLIASGTIDQATIRCELAEDEPKIFRFNLYQEMPGE